MPVTSVPPWLRWDWQNQAASDPRVILPLCILPLNLHHVASGRTPSMTSARRVPFQRARHLAPRLTRHERRIPRVPIERRCCVSGKLGSTQVRRGQVRRGQVRAREISAREIGPQ